MKHKHAEFIKAWADDPDSVQVRLLQMRDWCNVRFSGCFDETHVEFRHTPKPVYKYINSNEVAKSLYRCEGDDIRLTCIDGKTMAAEFIVDGDGK